MMTSGTNLRRILLCGTLLAVCPFGIAAQPASAPLGQLAVDIVVTRSGRPLRGAIVERRADGSLLMVVAAEWLQRDDPQRFETLVADMSEARREAWSTTRDRIQDRLTQPIDAMRLTFLLETEQQRLQKLIDAEDAPVPQFLWCEIPAAQVVRIHQAAADRQRMALVAWHAGITDVELRSAAALRKLLTDRGVEIDVPPPDLSERLPPRPQADREWGARLALVEYATELSLDFQGMGETVVRVNDGRALDWGALASGLLNQQVTALLKELDAQPPGKHDDDAWLAAAIAQATAAGGRGFRVTRVTVEPDAARVAVESRFVADVGEGDWRTIWSTRQVADPAQHRPELEQRIAADPRVREIFQVVGALGGDGDEVAARALQAGAATMAAQGQADAEFFRFRDRYLKQLDGPYLPVP